MEALMFVGANLVVALIIIWMVMRDSKTDASGTTGIFAFRGTDKNELPPTKHSGKSLSNEASSRRKVTGMNHRRGDIDRSKQIRPDTRLASD